MRTRVLVRKRNARKLLTGGRKSHACPNLRMPRVSPRNASYRMGKGRFDTTKARVSRLWAWFSSASHGAVRRRARTGWRGLTPSGQLFARGNLCCAFRQLRPADLQGDLADRAVAASGRSKRKRSARTVRYLRQLSVCDRLGATLLSSEYPSVTIRPRRYGPARRASDVGRIVHRPRSNKLKRVVV